MRKVRVDFYGEAECPFCREFVTKGWPSVWDDIELRDLVEYHSVPWGNAYFGTDECGNNGPQYSSAERQCWYEHCITTTSDDPNCFSGEVLYQHSKKEGAVDIYESCAIDAMGDGAVDFTFCLEGPAMDDDALASVEDLVLFCLGEQGVVSAFEVDPC